MIVPASRARQAGALWGALLLASTVGACGTPSGERPRELAGSPAQRLVGVWDVRFHLDRPVWLASPPPTHDVRGTVALIEDHVGGTSFSQLPAALHYGVYDVDFTRIGFDPRDRGKVPTAIGRASSDSVEIVLSPEASRMFVSMHGRFSDDSVVGQWDTYTRAGGGGGGFVMRRRR